MEHDFDDMERGEKEYLDDLGGAYYFADDRESFEPRVPSGGSGCAIILALLSSISAALSMGVLRLFS